MPDIYLDNAASTKPFRQALDAYSELSEDCYANPSSLHKRGIEASYKIKWAKELILSECGFGPDQADIAFTSGATEAANLAIKGIIGRSAAYESSHIALSAIEHPCVSEPCLECERKGASLSVISVDSFGQIDINSLKESVKPNTKIVSIIWANNEFGSIQDIGRIASIVKSKNPKALLHFDCVQGFGKLKGDFANADLITISAHKFHGPKGVGALIMRKGLNIKEQIQGGSQQGHMRSGTLNTPAIYAMAKALETMGSENAESKLRDLGEHCYNELSKRFGRSMFNSHKNGFSPLYAPHIFSLSFAGLKGEVIMRMLEASDIFISTGSACSSSAKEKPSALYSIGASADEVAGAVRISIGMFNTKEEISIMAEKLAEAVGQLSRAMGNKRGNQCC
ncbi:MAG: cysteine desulfurase [Eubacteriaceae bacterium]|nr:cysteine desulfurase [Eubacteriaceae bacterium]